MRRFLASSVALVLLGAVGCGDAAKTGPTATRLDTSIADVPVELKQVTAAKLDEALAENRGRILVVDCWVLGCAPCVAKFPEFVAMRNELSKQGIAFASLDVMPSEADRSELVLAFLKKQNAAFPNYLLNDKPNLVDMWTDRHTVEATPATLVFDRQGELLKNFQDGSADKVRKFVLEAAKK